MFHYSELVKIKEFFQENGYVVITDVFHKDESIIDIVSSVIRDRWERELYDELTEEFNTPPED